MQSYVMIEALKELLVRKTIVLDDGNEIPGDVVQYFKSYISTKEIAQAYFNGINITQMKLQLYTKGEVNVILKNPQFLVDPNGVFIRLDDGLFAIDKLDEEIVSMYTKPYVLLKLRYISTPSVALTSKKIVANAEVTASYPMELDDDREEGEKIHEFLVEHEVPFADALASFVGVDPKPENEKYQILRSFIVYRFISTFTKDFYSPFYVEFTRPNTIKSTVGIKWATSFNYDYVVGIPSVAHLVYDAKNKIPGAVWTKDGIILDEFDKSNFSGDHAETISALLTGIANGEWVREKGNVPPLQKHIPVLLMGNVNVAMSQVTNCTEYFTNALPKLLKVINIEPLMDRVTMCVINIDDVNASSFVTNLSATPRTLHNWKLFLTSKLDMKSYDIFEGRSNQAFSFVVGGLKLIYPDVDDDIIIERAKKLVVGDTT